MYPQIHQKRRNMEIIRSMEVLNTYTFCEKCGDIIEHELARK